MGKKKVVRTQASCYSSYNKAKQAVRKLKLKSLSEYKKRYKKDSKLPAHPDRSYKGTGWVDWYIFLGKGRPNFYSSYQKAKKELKKLSFTSSEEYKSRHRKDPRLPSHPDEFYMGKGWIDWYHFLGKKRN